MDHAPDPSIARRHAEALVSELLEHWRAQRPRKDRPGVSAELVTATENAHNKLQEALRIELQEAKDRRRAP